MTALALSVVMVGIGRDTQHRQGVLIATLKSGNNHYININLTPLNGRIGTVMKTANQLTLEYVKVIAIILVVVLIIRGCTSDETTTKKALPVAVQIDDCSKSGKVNTAMCYMKKEGYIKDYQNCDAFYAKYNQSVSISCLSKHSNGMAFNVFDNGRVKAQRWSGGKLVKEYYISNWK